MKTFLPINLRHLDTRTCFSQVTTNKQAQQVQCNIIEQFYVSNIPVTVTQRYSMHIDVVTHRTDELDFYIISM